MTAETSGRLAVDETTRIRRLAERQVTEAARLHEILDEAFLAHLAVVRDGVPLVLPFACARDGDALLMHGSTGAGALRLGAIGPVSVAVTHLDGLVFDRSTFESSMEYRSAVIHGTPEVLAGEARAAALRTLSDHLFPGRSAEVRESTPKELAATLVLRLPLDRASVKIADASAREYEADGPGAPVWAGVVPMRLVAGEPVPAADVPDGVPVPASVRRVLAAHE